MRIALLSVLACLLLSACSPFVVGIAVLGAGAVAGGAALVCGTNAVSGEQINDSAPCP